MPDLEYSVEAASEEAGAVLPLLVVGSDSPMLEPDP
jgi:hypothetical protein